MPLRFNYEIVKDQQALKDTTCFG